MQPLILPNTEDSMEIPMSSEAYVNSLDEQIESVPLSDQNELTIDINNNCSEIEIQSEKSDTQATFLTQISTTSESSQSIRYRNGEMSFRIPGIPSLVSTERKCCVCGQKGRKRIPYCAILDAFVKRRIHIPTKNRCCSHHLENGRFTDIALLMMTPQTKDSYMTGKDVAKWMTLMANHCIRCQRTLDFGGDIHYDDCVYRMLLGIGKEDFDKLHLSCASKMRNSKNR